MKTGTVRWFSTKMGYGFIEPDEGGRDVYIAIDVVKGAGMHALVEGQKLYYHLSPAQNAAVATSLQPANHSSEKSF